MRQIALSPKDQKELSALKSAKHRTAIMGRCGSCDKALPVGYLAVVTRWGSRLRGTFRVMVPEEMFCRECGSGVEGVPRHRRRRKDASESVSEAPGGSLSMKDLAGKIWKVVSPEEGRGSKKLTRLAGLDPDDEDLVKRVQVILRKLHEAGKVRWEVGKWVRV